MKGKDNALAMVTGAILVISITLIVSFGYHIDTKGWDSADTWAQFGSFVGGTLGPIFSLLTILYMVWSVREQMALMRKQIEQDHVKEECNRLLIEAQQYVQKMEALFDDHVEFAAIASEYLKALTGEEVEHEIVDPCTIRVNGNLLWGQTFSMICELEERQGVDEAKAFIRLYRGTKFIYPIYRAADDFRFMLPTMLEALSKGANINVLKSLAGRCDPIALCLNRWGKLSDDWIAKLKLIQQLPVDETSWESAAQQEYLDDLNRQQGLSWKIEELEKELVLTKSLQGGVTLTHSMLNEGWRLRLSGKWEKAS